MLWALPLLVACKGTQVDPEVPLDIPENRAPAVPVDGDDPYPELPPVFACGQGTLEAENQDYDWCHARAYLEHAPGVVIEGVMEPRVAVDFCNADFKVNRRGFDKDHEWSMDIHHMARSNLADVEYDVTWLCDHLEDDPAVIVCAFGKTEGSPLFPYFEGTIAIVEVDDGISEWQYVEQIRAPTVDHAVIKKTISDVLSELHAFLDGRPYPDCENL